MIPQIKEIANVIGTIGVPLDVDQKRLITALNPYRDYKEVRQEIADIRSVLNAPK
jgi:hypothetical protein